MDSKVEFKPYFPAPDLAIVEITVLHNWQGSMLLMKIILVKASDFRYIHDYNQKSVAATSYLIYR